MPNPPRLLETALYVSDLERSAAFYRDAFGFVPVESGPNAPQSQPEPRLFPLRLPGSMVLLLFRVGATEDAVVGPDGTIPGHGAGGRSHLAFAVPAEDLDGWRTRLTALGVPIENESTWPRGGRSVYFRDPDGHLLELATPGVWSIY